MVFHYLRNTNRVACLRVEEANHDPKEGNYSSPKEAWLYCFDISICFFEKKSELCNINLKGQERGYKEKK